MRPYATNQKKGADLMFGRMLIGLKTYFEVFNMAVDVMILILFLPTVIKIKLNIKVCNYL